jgi:DUF4097 and DUF4098 domain-containing protein YvlB
MILTVLAGALSLALAQQQTDTTVPARADVRIEVENFGGEITVKAWDRAAVRVVATHSKRDRISIEGGESALEISSEASYGPTLTVDYQLTVPAGASISVSGTYADIDVDGVRGTVSGETVGGDIKVRGGGAVTVSSVEGVVNVDGARGKVTAHAVNKGIRLSNIVGEVAAETVNGGIVLDGIDSDDVEAVTVNGDIVYDGTIRDKGSYHFGSHNGDIDIGVPPNANVTVALVSYEGRYSFDIGVPVPIPAGQERKRRITTTLGTGSARLDVESFQGSVRLRRPGSAPASPKRD